MEDDNMKLLTFPVKVESGSVFLDLPPIAELDQVTSYSNLPCVIVRIYLSGLGTISVDPRPPGRTREFNSPYRGLMHGLVVSSVPFVIKL